MSKTQAYIAIAFGCVVELADVFFKQIAIIRFPSDGNRISFPIGIGLHKNPGIAFDVAIPLPLVFLLTLVVGFWIGYRYRLAWIQTRYQEAVACIMILLGAFGNFFDRFFHNFTTDYLIFFRLSAINLSDILILLGMLGFLWYSSHHPQNSRL